MGQPTETKYDGWTVIPASSLEGDRSNNFHIADVKLDETKTKIIAFNREYTACCGRHIRHNASLPTKQPKFAKGSDDTLRTKLAEWQNREFEFCGNCVGHFYKDGD